LSPKIELLGAISHKEIFIDPNPNIEEAFAERKRLFTAKRGGWSQYNTQKISKGGGVFLRADKSITLTNEIKEKFNISENKLSGEELAKYLLTAKVDLLFNGGVGTYVKSSEESNSELGDVQNKGLRINGNQLQAKVVCEGGNLGFTQRGRIEFAKNGGRINLDGIDNSAGVNISDHEVNLKILFNILEKNEIISKDKSEAIFKELTENVMQKVLKFNYDQALAISLEEIRSQKNRDNFIKTTHILENNLVQFKRKFFGIPLKDRDFNTVLSPNGAIVRPILSFLISYSKIFVKNLLLEDRDFIQKAYLKDYLLNYFPESLVKNYSSKILRHPLRDEIIATMIADEVINNHGVGFINDFDELNKEDFLAKIKSYIIAEEFFAVKKIREKIAEYDLKVNPQEQYDLLLTIEKAISFSIDWMVKYFNDYKLSLKHILSYQDSVFETVKNYNNMNPLVVDNHLIKQDSQLFDFFRRLERLKFSVASINIDENEQDTFENVNHVLHEVISKFKIIELMENLRSLNLTLPEEKNLRTQLEDFIESILTDYTRKIVDFKRNNETAEEAFAKFIQDRDSSTFEVISELSQYLEQKENSNIIQLTVILNKLILNK
jgi:glutamate dehydrogenase